MKKGAGWVTHGTRSLSPTGKGTGLWSAQERTGVIVRTSLQRGRSMGARVDLALSRHDLGRSDLQRAIR